MEEKKEEMERMREEFESARIAITVKLEREKEVRRERDFLSKTESLLFFGSYNAFGSYDFFLSFLGRVN